MPNMKLTAGDMGVPDYMQALRTGMQASREATETAYKPKNMAEALLGQQLQNKMNAPKAAGAQQMFDTELGYKQALTNQANRPAATTGEIPLLFQLRNSLPAGADRDRVERIIDQKARGSNGTTVFDPQTGNPLVQIGGMGGKSGGGTFANPLTGEITSQPTGATASNLQGRIVGTEAVKPYLEEIIKTLPQFQNAGTAATLYGQKLANSLGGQNFSLPSEQASGKAAIKEASEGMIKSFGLNATGANRQAMEDILKPHFGESPQGYAERVQKQASAYANNQELAKQALRGGININKSKPTIKNRINVPAGKIRVYFPDGAHVIPEKLLKDAMKAGATLEREINPNGSY